GPSPDTSARSLVGAIQSARKCTRGCAVSRSADPCCPSGGGRTISCRAGSSRDRAPVIPGERDVPYQQYDVEQVGSTTDRIANRTADHSNLAARVLEQARPSALDQHAVVHLQASAGNSSVSRLIAGDDGPTKVRSVVGSGGGRPIDPVTEQLM